METGVLEKREGRNCYNAVWRWHFYAGVFSVPFLMLMAATGAIYLFQQEIEAWLYRDCYFVSASNTAALPASRLAVLAQAHCPAGELSAYTPPGASDRPACFQFSRADAGAVAVYMNPGTGAYLGSVDESRRAMAIVKGLHSMALFGSFTNGIVEAVAGWLLILVATGVYLWLPQGGERWFTMRGTPKRRVFWRDLHACTGIAVGAIVFFLAATGMPWTGVWGAWFGHAIRAIGQGMPAAVWEEAPLSAEASEHAGWTMRNGGSPLVTAAPRASIGLDRALAIATAAGIGSGFTISMPDGPRGVYTARRMPGVPTGQRTIHIDQYSGEILEDAPFADYGTLAKGIEWGISVHTGEAFGALNKALMLTGCIAVELLCISGIAMWWKRRPSARLGAPPLATPRAARRIALLMVAAGIAFPLTGLSMLLMATLDRFVLLGLPKVDAVIAHV